MFFRKRAQDKADKTKTKDRLTTSLSKNVVQLKTTCFKDDESVIYRGIRTREPHVVPIVLIYSNDLAKHEFLSDYIVRPLMIYSLPKGLRGQRLIDHLVEHVIQADGISTFTSFQELAKGVVDGAGVILVEGSDRGILVDSQGWEKRAVTEPQSESAVRGPREGFTEELGVNVSLVRRKIKSPDLKVKNMQVGLQTKTKLAIMYVEGLVSPGLLEEVCKRIEKVNIDAILESGYLEELIRDSPNSPLPTIGHTERPDKVAAKLLEGRVAILVDGTPFALTMPYLFVEAFQANEDYYHHWLAATFHRLVRYSSFFLTTCTPGLYLALVTHEPQLIPMNLAISISAARKSVPFPAIVEIILMGFVFEVLREGGVRLPRPIGQTISIVGAIVLGDAAVGASLVSAPMIIVVGITAVAGFVVAQLNDASALIRLLLVLASAVLGLYGFLLGVMAVSIHLAAMKSFGVPYLSAFTSLSAQGAKDTVLRAPWRRMIMRPRQLSEGNPQREKRKSRGTNP